MKKCIICFEEKNDDEFSEEHIIPKAFGNKKLKIFCVCKNCNNQMGSEIDGKYAKNPGIKLFKQQIALDESDEKTDYHFNGTDDEGNNYIVNKDFSKIKIQARVVDTKNGFLIHASNKEEAIEIVEKKYNRKEISEEIYHKALQEIEKTEIKKVYPVINIDCSLDLRTIKIEVLKISYEFMYYKFGEEIFQLDDISNIRKILLKIIRKQAVDESEYTKYINNEVLDDKLSINCNAINNEIVTNRYINKIYCFSKDGYIFVHVEIKGFSTYTVCISNFDNVIKPGFYFEEAF